MTGWSVGICQSFPGDPKGLSVLRTASVEVGVEVMSNLGVGQRSHILGLCHCYLASFLN